MIPPKIFILVCLAALSYVAYIGANKCNKLVAFQCADQKACIHKSWRCDGEEDCSDGSDERNCKAKKCAAGEFKCKNKKCIPESQRCDSIDQCGDNSDEVGCSYGVTFPCTQPGAFECTASNVCIDKAKLCNKVRDCPMGDDEDSSCGVNECLKNNGGCSQKCIDEKIGYKCACRDGYSLSIDGKTCLDIDECKSYGQCYQKCHNTVGSYNCQCIEGYALQSDGKSCKAKGDRPTLVIANLIDISQYSLDGKDSKRLVYGNVIGSTLAMDVNPHDGYLYWADYVKKTVARAPINDAKNVVVVANDKLTKAEGIAIDWIGEKLYWTNSGKKSIEVSNTDGSHRTTLFDSELEMPRGIALLPFKRLMFWTDWGSSPKIERASMDGADRKTVIGSAHLKWPNTVTVDQVLDRLYWIDSGKGYIGSSNLDGTDLRKIVMSNTESSFGLAVFEGAIYWTQTRGKVLSADKFDGKNKREIRGAYFKPFAININHPLAKPKGVNPCGSNNGGCKNLCLLSATNEKGFACA